MAQKVRFPGILRHVVISREGDEWFASISVKIEDDSWIYPHRCETQTTVGIDLGIKTLATLSTGEKFENPKATKRYKRKLAHAQHEFAKKQKGSNNREKAKLCVSKVHLKIKRSRKDVIHKMTSSIVKRFRWIGIEDLNIQGMVKNRKLAKSVSDGAFFEIRRQLAYKSVLSGSNVAVAARFFPSSKLFSNCKCKLEELNLSVRKWICSKCGEAHDRDENAAKNLEVVVRSHWDTLNACGENARPQKWQFSSKQESKQNLKSTDLSLD